MSAKYGVRLLVVGRLRETFWQSAQEEYKKRLTGYTSRLEIVEVADEPTPDGASLAQENQTREKEGERLLARLSTTSRESGREYIIALDGQGKAFTSESFAAHLLRQVSEEGVSGFTLIIGGSLGLSDAVRTRADLILSFGTFTYPHQLMRVILLEQIYRAFKIQHGQAYHK